METKETQQAPKTTPGEMKIDFGSNIIIHNFEGRAVPQSRNEIAVIPKSLIGGTYHISREVAEANAKKLVKGWNNEWKIDMHDELVLEIKNLVYNTVEFYSLPLALQKRFDKLLKQVEGR